MEGLDELTNGIVKAIEVAPKLYDDAISPTAKEAGGLMSRIPKAINAAFAPLDIWIAKKEYNVKETKLLLEKKLKNKESENIVTPEPYIAVPAIQGISYCCNSDELRNMYANLLANAMDTDVKSNVHPAFVEIIKQLSPFEAKLIKMLSRDGFQHPIVKVRYQLSERDYNGVDAFSNIISSKYGITFDNLNDYSVALENLARLKIVHINYDESYSDDNLYKDIENSETVRVAKELNKKTQYSVTRVKHGVLEFSSFGKMFVKICVND